MNRTVAGRRSQVVREPSHVARRKREGVRRTTYALRPICGAPRPAFAVSRRSGFVICFAVLSLFVDLPCDVRRATCDRSVAYAEEVSVVATVDRKRVSVGGTIGLSIEVKGAQDVPAPDVTVDGCAVRYVGPSTYISVVNRQVASSITHTYALLPQREGALAIGPIAVQVDGRSFQTEPITVEAVSASAPSRAPSTGVQMQAGADEGQTEISQALQLQLEVDRRKMYLGQAVPARLQLFVRGAPLQNIALPTLQADGFLARPFGQPKQSEVIVGGQLYDLLEFDTVIVPLKSGTPSLGPGNIECQLIARHKQSSPLGRRPGWPFGEDLFEEFFARTEVYPVTVTSKPVEIEVLPLPEEGRPSDFGGAVGHFTLEMSVVPTEVAVGEPVTVKMVVRGEGNFDTVTAPKLQGDLSRFKVYEPQRWRGAVDEAEASERVFEQVLIPLDPSVREVPTARFSYFDPEAGRYETLTEGPVLLMVTPAPMQERVAMVDRPLGALVAAATEPEVLGRDIVYIKETLGPARGSGRGWYRQPIWWWLQAGRLVLLMVSEWLRRRRERLAADPGMARASGVLRRALAQCQAARRLQQGKAAECYAEVFRSIQRYMGDRFNLSSDGLTRAELEQYLQGRGAPAELVHEVLEVVDRCDAARFAPSAASADQAASTLQTVEAVLKRLERWKPS